MPPSSIRSSKTAINNNEKSKTKLHDSPHKRVQKTYSGFPSEQLEQYYSRIHLKMVEVLTDFIVQCLSKDLSNIQSFIENITIRDD